MHFNGDQPFIAPDSNIETRDRDRLTLFEEMEYLLRTHMVESL